MSEQPACPVVDCTAAVVPPSSFCGHGDGCRYLCVEHGHFSSPVLEVKDSGTADPFSRIVEASFSF